MSELTMPQLSDSMEQGTILSWLKGDGEQVEPGEDLLEIETDKATVTHSAETAGTLSILVPEGTTVAVGTPIAHIGAAGGAPSAANATPVGTSAVAMPDSAAEPVAGNGRRQAPGRSKATPLARRIAEAHGLALEDLSGSGPLGRITRGDVMARLGLAEEPPPLPAAPPPAPPAPAPAAARAATGAGAVERVELTRLQALVARRMADAKATVPEFQVETEVAMDAAIAFRAELKAAAPETPPSLNDLIVKAAALALRAHPRANGSYADGAFHLHARVNVGIAVAADDALVVPTIFDADQRSIGAIARESRRLAEAVRDGRVTPSELEGATFTVSNLGMFGMTAITPVINAPQAAILGVGSIRDTLARVDGEIVDRRLMTLRLTCDHRILYGADAARFLSDIRELLEQPLRLALG